MPVPGTLDHLVYAVPDLGRAVAALGEALGVAPLAGGVHPAWGTRNAIVPLGPDRYLELIGPDPERADPAPPVIFGIAALTAPRLATWAARARDLPALVARARAAGVRLGEAAGGSRARPDGTLLRWELTDPLTATEGGLVPFFIDWGTTPHPAASAPAVVRLVELRAEHPAPERVRQALGHLGLSLEVSAGPAPVLRATLEGPRGVLTLR